MFENKHILVTGATSGIGRQTVHELLERGARITAVGRNRERLDALQREGGEALDARAFDLTDFARYADTFADLAPIDGLVYSAGMVENNPLRFFSMEKYQRTVDINQTAPLALVAELARGGKIARGASLVLVSSILGPCIGMKGTTAYAGTKAALTAFGKSMALELAHKSIRVNCVAPGMVETELVANADQLSNAAVEADKARYPLGKRYAHVAEIASAIRYLLSEDASFVTGQTLVIDGGYCAQ